MKLHNAMWPGLVGKEPDTDHPPISLDRMLELTVGAEVNGRKFDGVDLFIFHPHTDPDASEDEIKAMADMRSDMQAEMNNGVKITAVNAADKINKMRQILCGVVKDPKTENYVEIDHKPRTEVLLEAIENASAKVLVVVPFKGIIRSLETELQKAGHTVGVLNGDVSPRLRDKIVLDFKTQPDPHVLLCHPKVMAHGLNLTEADTKDLLIGSSLGN